MENILWGLLSIYLILNNSMIKLITSMVQLRTSKKLYKFTHLIAILLILIPLILVPYFIETNITMLSKNYIYIIGTISLLYSFLIYEEITKNTIIKNGNFNPPNRSYTNKKRRLNLLLSTIVLLGAFHGLLYYVYKKIHLELIIPSSIGLLFLLVSYIRYNSCTYKFPISWNN
jgi:hypothetical protein